MDLILTRGPKSQNLCRRHEYTARPLMYFNPIFSAFSILDLASRLDILSPPEMAFGFYLVVEVENVIPDLP